MFELKKLITAMILPPFNILILWGLSLILAKFNFKKLSRISTALGFSLLYLLSIPYTAQVLKDSLITEDHLTLQDYQPVSYTHLDVYKRQVYHLPHLLRDYSSVG